MDVKNIVKNLEGYFLHEKDGYVEILLPIVFFSSHGSMLKLTIAPKDEGYIIACVDDLFYESNGPQERYFNIFMKNDKNYHYDMLISNNVIYKEYPRNRSINTALDEVIRFFILFDDFIMGNDVVGHEEDFE